MSVITGSIVPSPNLSILGPALQLGPNSRLSVQLLDVSRMDAPSVTLSEQTTVVGPDERLYFPIPYNLVYNALDIKPSMSYAIAARVVDITHGQGEDAPLTWISTSRHSVLTHDAPLDNVLVELDQITPYPGEDALPEPVVEGPRNTIRGLIQPSTEFAAAAGISPNSQIKIQLSDVSLMDAPSVTIAEQIIVTHPEETKAFPIEFAIEYDAGRIQDMNEYAIQVRVENVAKPEHDLQWISTWRNSVLTRDSPKDNVEISIDRIPEH